MKLQNLGAIYYKNFTNKWKFTVQLFITCIEIHRLLIYYIMFYDFIQSSVWCEIGNVAHTAPCRLWVHSARGINVWSQYTSKLGSKYTESNIDNSIDQQTV